MTPTGLLSAKIHVLPPPPQYPQPRHLKGTRAKILLASIFGPYARDDAWGSRTINPMELYHNQVTRFQGPFSLRMFHRSWGLMMIQANLDAPCTLLDFPTLDRFIEELRRGDYDIVGISAIPPNIEKVDKMCQLIREHLPQATILVGGHVANVPGLEERIDADQIVRGEGVRWFQRYLGQDDAAPLRHPVIPSGVGGRTMGMSLSDGTGHTAATVIPSVGCPMGCNFCATSALFGGKGKFVSFYESGDALFEIMCELQTKLATHSFFIMDENFLLHRKRALRLLELMESHHKAWSLYVFSSAQVLKSYTLEELVRLGISWVWMGLEGEQSRYKKLHGIDTHALVETLRSHGICIVGSSIIGLEQHRVENIDRVIDYAVRHDTEFHQFMLYTPVPGTPLYREHEQAGTLLPHTECAEADSHGQLRFNFRHPHIRNGAESELLARAFLRDFERNGPSILRMARTILQGWKRYKNHPDARIRERFAHEAERLPSSFAAGLWAARHWFREQPPLRRKADVILQEIYQQFGIRARIAAPTFGWIVRFMLRREDRKLRQGWTYEPPTFYETNVQETRRSIRKGKRAGPAVWVATARTQTTSSPRERGEVERRHVDAPSELPKVARL